MLEHGFEKIIAIETVVPYNNPSYGYPSLKMFFRKNEVQKELSLELQYSDLLRNKMHSYIAKENEHILIHKHIVNELQKAKTNVFV